MSHAALKTEALLRKPLTSALYNAQDIVEVMEALHEMGLDTVLTTSATEDSLTPDETWEIIGNSNEIGVTLTRYLRSHNAVYEVSKKGAIRFISADEMNDAIHFQTIVYRVDHLARDFRELTALADQIQSTFLRDNWEYGGGSATMQPRIQSGHRLLIVSIHYQHHLMLQQFLYELTVATTGMPAALPSSSIGAASANGR
jgi:xanthine dehydrogenase iron-sulfur cluster and FAD-binding subunit A